MTPHHNYTEGDEVAITLVGKVNSSGGLDLRDENGAYQMLVSGRFAYAADHYKIEPPEPRWQDLKEGTVFRFGDGGCTNLLRTRDGAVRLDNPRGHEFNAEALSNLRSWGAIEVLFPSA